MRYLHKRQRLEQWKVALLNELRFEWSLPEVEARWYNMYHQLRRFKILYGHTQVPRDYRHPHDKQLSALPAWIAKQVRYCSNNRKIQCSIVLAAFEPGK